MPYKYSFINGHSYFTNSQVDQIKEVLESDNPQSKRDDYEGKFASLIGDGLGISFAAGRMAFYVLIKALEIGKGDEIILPGFTCSVMVNAILRAGATPVFANIDVETFGSSAEEIEPKITNRTKLIVAQHTFGIPCRIDKIVELGRSRGIFVVEDCALVLDSSFKNQKIGNWGNAAIFSTDHSKPLNTLIGGFFYTKDKFLYRKMSELAAVLPDLAKDHQRRLFSQFLFERKYFQPGRYKNAFWSYLIRGILKRLRGGFERPVLLGDDYSGNNFLGVNYPYPAKLPSFIAQIGLFELESWPKVRAQRIKLLKQYLEIMKDSKLALYIPKIYFNNDIEIVPFRYVFTHPDAIKIKGLMSKHINVGQILFNAPIVCCPNGLENLGYSLGTCPKSEKICDEIINWPCSLPERYQTDILDIFKSIAYH